MTEYSLVENLLILESQKNRLQIRHNIEQDHAEKEKIAIVITEMEKEIGSIQVKLTSCSENL